MTISKLDSGDGNDAPSLAASIQTAGTWDTASRVDTVLLDHDRRFRRRFLLHTETGRAVLLDLPHAVRLRQDDGLILEDGGVVLVCARAESLIEITAQDPSLLLRIIWHLGNRHLPAQFLGDRVRIRHDHVIAAMVEGLGGQTHPVDAAFDPEAGAYAGGHHHHHDDDDGQHHPHD